MREKLEEREIDRPTKNVCEKEGGGGQCLLR